MYNQTTDELVTAYLSVSGTETIDIVTSDRALVGTQLLYIKAIVAESLEELEREDFELKIFDSCESATITVAGLIIEPISMNALEPEKYVKSYGVVTDTVSDGFGIENNCG